MLDKLVRVEKGELRENNLLRVDISALNLSFIKAFPRRWKNGRYGKARGLVKSHSFGIHEKVLSARSQKNFQNSRNVRNSQT
jgi:hypothetical protein